MKRIYKIALMLAVSLSAIAAPVNYSYDAIGRLIQADYGNGSTITYTYDSSGNLLTRTITGPDSGRSFTISAVVNAASLKSGPIAPGEMVMIFGSGAGQTIPTLYKMSSRLNGTRVLFDGVPAPIYYASSGQYSVSVPFEIAGSRSTDIVVEYQGVRSRAVTLPVAAAAPGLFTSGPNGSGQGVIVNQDGSFNTALNPASKGSLVSVYLTGDGQARLSGENPKSEADIQATASQAAATIGRVAAHIQNSGAQLNDPAGFTELKVVVPMDAPSGAEVPLVVFMRGVASQPGVTLAIQ